VARRKKLSTTISPEGYSFLRALIRSGRANNLAEAVDLVLEEVQRKHDRERLERATAEYFKSRTPQEIADDQALEAALTGATAQVDFDE
jgi:hypothetical protein